MRKLFGAIFGSAKNTETIINGAVAGLDKLVFTKEEKAEANIKLGEWYLKYLEATQPQNLARRFIAIIVVALWAVIVLVGIASNYFHAGFSEYVFNTLSSVVNPPFMIIIGFYFAVHAIRAFNE